MFVVVNCACITGGGGGGVAVAAATISTTTGGDQCGDRRLQQQSFDNARRLREPT
jgi:hypothetical protein